MVGEAHGLETNMPCSPSLSVKFIEINRMRKGKENEREGETETKKEAERGGERKKREKDRDRKLHPQRNGRKEEIRSRQVLSLKRSGYCLLGRQA